MKMDGSTEKVCNPTASQEAKLPNSSQARESENFLESDNESSSSPDFTPSQPAGIVVLSLPDSPCPVEQPMVDEAPVFVTPPENHCNSQLSSSEDPNPEDLRAEQSTVTEAKEETEAATVSEVGLDDEVDGDAVPLGETEVVAVGSGDCGGEEIRATSNLDGADEALILRSVLLEIAAILNGRDTGDHELGESMEDIGESPREAKRARKSDTSGGGGSSGKRIEEIDEFRYESSVVDGVEMECQGRRGRRGGRSSRKLPTSLGEEKEKEKVVSESSEEKSGLAGFLERLTAAIMDSACDPDDEDIVATAKKLGIEFPRPRWWPAEDDEEMEFFRLKG